MTFTTARIPAHIFVKKDRIKKFFMQIRGIIFLNLLIFGIGAANEDEHKI